MTESLATASERGSAVDEVPILVSAPIKDGSLCPNGKVESGVLVINYSDMVVCRAMHMPVGYVFFPSVDQQ